MLTASCEQVALSGREPLHACPVADGHSAQASVLGTFTADVVTDDTPSRNLHSAHQTTSARTQPQSHRYTMMLSAVATVSAYAR